MNLIAQDFSSKQVKSNFHFKNSKDDGILTYFNFTDTSMNCLGAPNMLLMMMNRFTATELTPYNDALLTTIAFAMVNLESPNETTGLTDVKVYVYQGGTYAGSSSTNNSGTLVAEQAFSGTVCFDSLNVLVLNTPVTIDASKELWVGVSAKVTNGFPLPADLTTDFNDKGNLAGTYQNERWYIGNVNEFMGEGSSFDGDFAIISYVETEVGIQTLSYTNVGIYPNPAQDILRCTNVDNSKISIFDVTGKMVLSHNPSSANETIDVSNLNQGIYLVKIQKGNDIITKKINIVR